MRHLLEEAAKRVFGSLEESTITTVTGNKDIRPGTKHVHEIVKYHGIHKHETGAEHRVFTVKQPNGFHKVLITDKDKTHVVGSSFGNSDKETAMKTAEHYKKQGTIGMKSGHWYHGGDKIVN